MVLNGKRKRLCRNSQVGMRELNENELLTRCRKAELYCQKLVFLRANE